MLLATLLAAFTPLYISLSPTRIAVISTYATGLLVGAALTVIIPEGVEAVYDNRGERKHGDHAHSGEGEMAGWIGTALLAGFILMYVLCFSSHTGGSRIRRLCAAAKQPATR